MWVVCGLTFVVVGKQTSYVGTSTVALWLRHCPALRSSASRSYDCVSAQVWINQQCKNFLAP